VSDALFETFGMDKRDPFPFYSWAPTAIPATGYDPEVMMRRWPRCDGCGMRGAKAEPFGCGCGAGDHVLCPKCVVRMTEAGVVLELGAEPPVVLEVCPDELRLARLLMEGEA